MIDALIVKNITPLLEQAPANPFARQSFWERASKNSLQLFEPTDLSDVI